MFTNLLRRRSIGLVGSLIGASISSLVFFSVAHAGKRCEDQFVSAVARDERTDDELIATLQAALPKNAYFIPSHRILKISTDLSIPIEKTRLLLPTLASKRARPTISNYFVGAAGVTPNGDVILGANFEFFGTSLGASLHGERTVMLLAMDLGTTINAIYINAPPCGGCRQWLNEIGGGGDIRVVSKDLAQVPFDLTVKELLPHDFGPRALGESGLLDAKQFRSHRSDWVLPATPNLSPRETESLLSALEKSYAPYSRSPSAVLIRLKDGTSVTGSYTEQAAFESYDGLTIALMKLMMTGKDLSQIATVVLADVSGAKAPIDHVGRTTLLLQSIQKERGTNHPTSTQIEFQKTLIRPK